MGDATRGMRHEKIARHAMEILFCANAAFFPQLAVAAISVAENRSCDLNINVLSCDAGPSEMKLLSESLAEYDGVSVVFHRLDKFELKHERTDRFTKEVYL